MAKKGEHDSTAYQFTLTNLNDERLVNLRKVIKDFNALKLREYSLHTINREIHKTYRVCIFGRYGDNNPTYQRGQRCKLKDAVRFDVYVHSR